MLLALRKDIKNSMAKLDPIATNIKLRFCWELDQ